MSSLTVITCQPSDWIKAANPLPYLPSEYSKIYGTVGIVEMTQAPYSCKVDRLR